MNTNTESSSSETNDGPPTTTVESLIPSPAQPSDVATATTATTTSTATSDSDSEDDGFIKLDKAKEIKTAPLLPMNRGYTINSPWRRETTASVALAACSNF